MKCVIGVDLGTSATKAALFDSSGLLLASASEQSKLSYPKPGWVEQDPEEFFTSTCNTIREVLRTSSIDAGEVKALSISGQMAGIIGIDNEWRAVTHYDSWLDTRCEEYVQRIRKNSEDRVLTLSGLPTDVAHCAKILWWKHEAPEVYKRVKKFIQPAAYVAGRLAQLVGSDAFIDHTYLHFTGLCDLQQISWSAELCSDLGIPEEILPSIVEPWNVIGTITTEASKECGLRSGTPIAAGAGDQAASFLGAGVVEPGLVVDVAGTASVLSCCVADYRPDLKHKILFFPKAVVPDLWYPHTFIRGGGLCLRWFRDNVIGSGVDIDDVYKTLDEESRNLPPGSDLLFFVPHLGGRQSPYHNETRGSWTGLSWGHDRRHLYRSILESIAYEYGYFMSIEKSLFPEVRFKEIRVFGGGARSTVFNQIKSNVLGIPYVQLSRDEVGELGSAIVAGYAVGIFRDIKETAQSFVDTKNRIEPDMKVHERYGDIARVYYELTERVAPVYEKMAQLS